MFEKHDANRQLNNIVAESRQERPRAWGAYFAAAPRPMFEKHDAAPDVELPTQVVWALK